MPARKPRLGSVSIFRATAIILTSVLTTSVSAAEFAVPGGGFESELSSTWGDGQHWQAKSVWWNSKGCQSSANIDTQYRHSGNASLHISNRSSRAPHVFGTTQQPIAIAPGRRYEISLWAKARGLASDGAVSIVVDSAWKVRPIQLRKGTYDWTQFRAEFTLQEKTMQLRILSEDQGEAWLDDLRVVEVESEERQLVRDAAAAVGAFRQTALRDFETAIRKHSTPDVRDRLNSLGEQLWFSTEPRTGWSFFVNTSVVSVAEGNKQQPLVAFYNPWCDVFLIVAWDKKGGRFQIQDAEVVMGDLIRSAGRVPVKPIPLWLRTDLFRPAALGTAVAESVIAFETVFRGASADTWRGKLPELADPIVLEELNYPGAALLCYNAWSRVEDFRDPNPDEPVRLEGLRKLTSTAMKSAAEGRVSRVLEDAQETLPAIHELLQNWPPDVFRELVVVGTVLANDVSFVFLAPRSNADCCISLLITGDETDLKIKRIDVVGYQQIYDALKSGTNRAAAR